MSTSYDKDSSSKSNDDGVCEMNEMLQNMSTADNNMSVCANCGKEGANNTCNKCKMVMYCNAACKKKHRTKHKKQCERRVAELHDEQLFKDHPPREECPICLLPLPSIDQTIFKSCCGKTICKGCILEMIKSEIRQELKKGRNRESVKQLCPFCRMPVPIDGDEEGRRTVKLVQSGNVNAINVLGQCYSDGSWGMPLDFTKANELYLKAGDHGCAGGHYNLSVSYLHGYGVDQDIKKAKHYFELAAINGYKEARQALGIIEESVGSDKRATRHFIIGARAGHEKSLDEVKARYLEGLVAKEEYANTLREYQKRQDEMKSDARDKAAESNISWSGTRRQIER